MITEQKLNEIGKEKYISFVELIMALLERKDFRSSLPVASTRLPLNLNIVKSPGDFKKLVEFTPAKEAPFTLKIPGSSIEKIIGEKQIRDGSRLSDARNCLIDDRVLKSFLDPNATDADFSKGFFVPNELYAINEGRHKEMRLEEFDMVVSPSMTVSEINQYIKDVRSIGTTKHEIPTHSIKKSGKEAEDEKVTIVIDEENGIYRKDDRKKIYSIYGARKEYVVAIYKNNGRTMQELQKVDSQSQSVVSRGIAEINSSVIKKLGVEADLIVKNKTVGKYMLNKENFTFADPRHVE